MVSKISNLIYKILIYITLIPFLMPIGWEVYSNTYKNIVDIMSVIGILAGIAVIIMNKKIYLKKTVILIIVSCLELLLTTIVHQGGINEGIKKIFIVPILCLVLSNLLMYNYKEVVNVIANILLVILLMNVTVFSQYLFPQYFLVDKHMTFIGHVQSISMISTLGILLGFLKIKSENRRKYSGIFLIMLSIINMIYSDTDASYLSLGAILILTLLGRNTVVRKIINNQMTIIGLGYFLVNICILTATAASSIGRMLQAISSGRSFVWNIGMPLVKEKLLFGYGAYGVKIAPFWTKWSTNIQDKQGFNYAHNTILQLLLDGGITLLILSIIAIWLCVKNVGKLKSENIQYMFNSMIIVWLLISTVESVVEYYYIFIFLMIVLCYLKNISVEKVSK